MLPKLALAALFLAGCLSPLPADTLAAHAGDDLLPPATRALVVPEEDEHEHLSLLALLREFGDCTGQRLLLNEQDALDLRSTRLPELAGQEVPPAEVYPFVRG